MLDDFKALLARPDLVNNLRAGLIGDDITIDGPFGPKPLIYADYVASGRALRIVEDYVLNTILPYYANSHTQASYCGSFCTRMRDAARAEIGRIAGVDEQYSVLFTGSGATAGINRIVGLLDIAGAVREGKKCVILVGPYEHHSNLLPWRETGAQVHEIDEADAGGPCLVALEAALVEAADADILVGTFSAASNVTGIISDVDAISRLLNAHGAISVWDYGCAAPYLPVLMNIGTDASKDAVIYSSHKFPGGPGASGITIIRDAIVRARTPTLPGGGTVSFVSPWSHIYSSALTDREEGGTPNVIGDIRAALVMLIKEALGVDWLMRRQDKLRSKALEVWARNPQIEILGAPAASSRLPIFSFRIRSKDGDYVHHQLFTRMLSDVYGIQARGGCACAGSYAHRLLYLSRDHSNALLKSLEDGHEIEKPGWVRLNLSALMTDEKAAQIVKSVDVLARDADKYVDCYQVDLSNARFEMRAPAKVGSVSVL